MVIGFTWLIISYHYCHSKHSQFGSHASAKATSGAVTSDTFAAALLLHHFAAWKAPERAGKRHRWGTCWESVAATQLGSNHCYLHAVTNSRALGLSQILIQINIRGWFVTQVSLSVCPLESYFSECLTGTIVPQQIINGLHCLAM